MNKSTLVLIGSLLILLLALQVFWIWKNMEAENEIFLQKTSLAYNSLNRYFAAEESKRDQLHYLLEEKHDTNAFNRTWKTTIDSALRVYGLPVNYHWGIYTHADEGLAFVFGNYHQPTRPLCPADHSVNLLCRPGSKTFAHLILHFDNAGFFQQPQTIYSFLTSLGVILLLAFGFIYILKNLRQQRLLAEHKDDFINTVSHELKTPVFSLNLATGLLRSSLKEKLGPKDQRYLEIIQTEASRLQSHVEQVLESGRTGSAFFVIQKKEVNLHHLLDEVIRSRHVEGSNVVLQLNASDPVIEGDRSHLQNAVFNLVDNAIKYSPAPASITIITEDRPGTLRLIIKDQGIGMSAEVQAMAFEKFYRAAQGDLHSVKGFGLGLNYVKKIVEAHGSTIRIQSIPRKGSSFIIDFKKQNEENPAS